MSARYTKDLWILLFYSTKSVISTFPLFDIWEIATKFVLVGKQFRFRISVAFSTNWIFFNNQFNKMSSISTENQKLDSKLDANLVFLQKLLKFSILIFRDFEKIAKISKLRLIPTMLVMLIGSENCSIPFKCSQSFSYNLSSFHFLLRSNMEKRVYSRKFRKNILDVSMFHCNGKQIMVFFNHFSNSVL